MEGMKKREERMEKQLHDVTVENRKLVEPLRQAQADVTEFNKQMKNYEKDKMSLATTKTRLGICLKELEDLKWENEVLELRFEKVNIIDLNTN
jgi:predicted nuclease with TOPRIM domain